MSLNKLFTALPLLMVATPLTFAGDVILHATGVVAGGSASSGPFAGVTTGQTVDLYFEISYPGVDVAPGQLTNYPIDNATFVLQIGPNSDGLAAGSHNCGIQNDFPVSDGVRIFSVPLAGGQNMAFEFGEPSGTIFTSTDPGMNTGTWSSAIFSSYNFSVTGPGAFIDIMPIDFTIALPGPGTNYCMGAVNSTGLGGTISATGSASLATNNLILMAQNLPANMPGIFFYGQTQTSLPFGDGFRCVTTGLFRINPPQFSDAAGNMTNALDLTAPLFTMGGGAIAPGDTRHFQCWYRDPAAAMSGFNLTDAYTIQFTN